MSLKRRQVLILGGAALGGLSLSIVTQRLLGMNAGLNPTPSASPSSAANELGDTVTPQSSPSESQPTATNPDAEGLFNPPKGDVRMVVISDLNSQYGSTDYEPEVDQAIALLSFWQPDLVLCGGDMVAGQSRSLSDTEIQAMWDGFDRHISTPLRAAGIPFGFTIGNHDGSGAIASDGSFSFARDRAIATDYWTNPTRDPGLQFIDRAKFPFYYTFQQNNIFFLVWDASTSEITPEQLTWVERSLSSSAAQSAKLRIVIGHLPLYAVSVGRDTAGNYLDQAEELRSRLERHQVHTYISGHHHAYYPGHKGELELLHCGVLGSGKRSLLNGDVTPFKSVTVIDVNLTTADTIYTTYNMETMTVVDQQQLPKLIVGPNGKILRRDVSWESLTPEEQALEYVPS
jgi:Calcineurin-like phosphoesterase